MVQRILIFDNSRNSDDSKPVSNIDSPKIRELTNLRTGKVPEQNMERNTNTGKLAPNLFPQRKPTETQQTRF